MKFNKSFSTALLAVIIMNSQAQENPPPGVATGEKIGNIVKSAVTTAFPAVEKLMSLIWKNDDNKITKKDLETQLKEARKTLIGEAQVKLQPLDAVVAELNTIKKFLNPTVKANDNLLRMSVRDPAMANYWDIQGTDWKIVKAQLTKLSSLKGADVSLMRSKWLEDKLSQILETNSDIVIRIDDDLANKRADLKQHLEELSKVLGGITSAVGYLIADLQDDLNNLTKWSKGAASTDQKNLSAEGKDFESILNSLNLKK